MSDVKYFETIFLTGVVIYKVENFVHINLNYDAFQKKLTCRIWTNMEIESVLSLCVNFYSQIKYP